MQAVKRYLFPLLIACCLLFATPHAPKDAVAGTAVWSYHEKNYELYAPVLSRDNTQLAFVRKLHVPDGHEAELFSDEELRKFMEPLGTDPRFEDPEIVLMNLSDKNARFIDFGWEPSFSSDQTKLYYAHQKKPISGLRVLGTTLTGNDIRAYALSGGEPAVMAEPAHGGYLSSPRPTADGNILYTLSDAVNGAWGAAIGVGSFEPATGQQSILYEPEKGHGLYHLVQTFEPWNGTCFVLRLRPLTGGTYLADSYAFELVDAQSGTVLYSWGEGEISRNTTAVGLRMCPAGPEVFDNGWKALPWENPAGTPESGQRPGISSPDCAHVAYLDKSEVAIHSVDTGIKRRWTSPKGIIQSLTWSPDSSRIILVLSHGGDFLEKFEHDELVVMPLDVIPPTEQ